MFAPSEKHTDVHTHTPAHTQYIYIYIYIYVIYSSEKAKNTKIFQQ